MARTIFHDDWSVDLVAPSGGVTVGVPLLIGNLFVIPSVTVAAGKPFAGTRRGVHTLPKTSAQAWTAGDLIYFDAANSRLDNTPGIGPAVAMAPVAAANPSSTGVVVLLGIAAVGSGRGTQVTTQQLTIAQINAGVTLLPAQPGRKYRMVGCKAIAYGGAVGATTTVDVLGTQAAAPVKLISFAQANLTQSTELRDGATGATILADGASFLDCDANTPITVGKTGASLTTATGVLFIFEYAID